MTRIAGWLVLLGWLIAGCGGGNDGGGVGQSCRNVLDCPSGLLCLNGVCQTGGGGGSDTAGGACTAAEDCGTGQECRDGACVVVVDGGGGGECSCAAEDPCTAVTPACGGCARTGSECAADADCDDEVDCTDDACVCGYCEYETSTDEGCCTTNAECDDGVECTVDTCAFNHCKHEGPPGCCGSAADCNDGDPCTTDFCTDGVCDHTLVGAGCCTSDAECDDGEWCTVDACVGGRCVHPRSTPDKRCGCATAVMCEDGNPCTRDLCEDRLCVYQAVGTSPAGLTCCADEGDCNDAALATTDTCFLFTCFNKPNPSCAGNDDCTGAFACYESRCADGVCVPAGTRVEGCCEADLDCDDQNPCTKDTCGADGRCSNQHELQPGCCRNDGQCGDGLDCTSEFCCQSDLCTGTTGSVARGQCVYTVRPGDNECCASDLECEDGLPCTFDVCVNGGCYSVDTGETCCQEDADCDDGNRCTEDACSEGSCSNRPIADCCNEQADCDDGNPCTDDECAAGGTCRHVRRPECCTQNSECNDQDVCTQDLCDGDSQTCEHPRLSPCCEVDADCAVEDPCRRGVCNAAKDCVYEAVAGCCHTTADCEDFDACTIDECANSRCHNRPSDAPQCCESTTTWSTGFPFGAVSVDDWTFNPPFAGFGWQVVNTSKANSAPYSLYYGNTDTGTYVTGFANLGTARTPVITLPNDDQVFFNCWVWMELPGDPTADFQIRVAPGPTYGVATPVWDESVFGGVTNGEFRYVAADLSAWRGQSVMIEFAFSTQKVQTPAGEGVYIDDIAVGSGCVQSPVECQIARDCVDADPCTSEACLEQSCDLVTVSGPTCCAPRTFSATFDNGRLQGFSTGILPGASTTYGWVPSDHRSASAPYALYFGDPTRSCGPDRSGEVCPAYGSDDEPARAAGTADIGPLPLAGLANPILSFSLWTDIDPIAPIAPDHLDVVVISQSTLQETVVWSSISEGLQSSGGAFVPVVIDLEPWAGQTVKIRFHFDTADGWGYGEGAYVDDVAIGEDCR